VLNELRLLASARLDSHLLLTVVLAGDQRLLIHRHLRPRTLQLRMGHGRDGRRLRSRERRLTTAIQTIWKSFESAGRGDRAVLRHVRFLPELERGLTLRTVSEPGTLMLAAGSTHAAALSFDVGPESGPPLRRGFFVCVYSLHV
jgi:hypothetical protein